MTADALHHVYFAKCSNQEVMKFRFNSGKICLCIWVGMIGCSQLSMSKQC